MNDRVGRDSLPIVFLLAEKEIAWMPFEQVICNCPPALVLLNSHRDPVSVQRKLVHVHVEQINLDWPERETEFVDVRIDDLVKHDAAITRSRTHG